MSSKSGETYTADIHREASAHEPMLRSELSASVENAHLLVLTASQLFVQHEQSDFLAVIRKQQLSRSLCYVLFCFFVPFGPLAC